jgi:hypothetical protein
MTCLIDEKFSIENEIKYGEHFVNFKYELSDFQKKSIKAVVDGWFVVEQEILSSVYFYASMNMEDIFDDFFLAEDLSRYIKQFVKPIVQNIMEMKMKKTHEVYQEDL